MSYTVEIIDRERTLIDAMGQMRTWLDHKGYVPVAFRSADSRDGLKFRVEFAVAAEAEAFARAFGGCLGAAPEKAIDAGE